MADMGKMMDIIKLPKIAKVICDFDSSKIEDVETHLISELSKPEIKAKLKPGMKIALGVGSRGIADLVLMAKTIVKQLQSYGADVFIIPTMGSHGGATAEGQLAILNSLGVTEESMGCKIVSSMETVDLGEVEIPELGAKTQTYCDKNAYNADGIVLLNRVKVHPAFKDTLESGMCKMIAIGLGKQKGAQAYHTAANGKMGRVVEHVAKSNLEKCKILFAVGSVENAFDKICMLKAVPNEKLIEEEKQMLCYAKKRIGHLPFNTLDVLIAKQMGKEISGEGLDPNITGKRGNGHLEGAPVISRIGVLQLSDVSDGNVVGIGAVDAITEKLYSRINFDITYKNALTTGGHPNVRIPMTLKNDRQVIASCLHGAKLQDTTKGKMILIKDTLHLSEIYVSEIFKEDIEKNPTMKIVGQFEEIPFDNDGNLTLKF